MSFIFETAQNPVLSPNPTEKYAGGEADFSELFEASYESMRYVDNVMSSTVALEDSYDERASLVLEKTGRVLDNPFRRGMPEGDELDGLQAGDNIFDIRMRAFDSQLEQIAQEFPDLEISGNVRDAAIEKARAADERLGRFMASTSGLGKWGAVLAGGMRGAMEDPFQVATMALGAGAGTAKTIGGRILQTAGVEAVVNGSVEAAMQPVVQAWRKKIGVEHGLDVAMKNIGFATLFGGVFGASFKAVGEGIGKMLPPAERNQVAAALVETKKLDSDVVEALNGNPEKAVDVLQPIKEALTPEARGAMDAIEIERMPSRPESANADIHSDNMSEAARAVELGEIPKFSYDKQQMARLVDGMIAERSDLVPSKTVVPDSELNGVEFIAANGGIKDFKGELAALGADVQSVKFVGKLVKENGKKLDTMREAMAEAGYFNQLYGTAEQAVAKSSVNDLFDLIDADMNGQKTYPAGFAPTSKFDIEGERRQIESHMDEVLQLAGPGLPDEVIMRASQMNRLENVPLDDAIERAVMEMPEPVDIEGADELLAASRQVEEFTPDIPEPEENIAPFFDDVDEAELAAFGDVMVPDELGGSMPARDMIALAGRDNQLAEMVEICNV